MIFNATIIIAMGLTTTYRPDTVGVFKLVAAAVMGLVLGFFVKMAWVGSFQLRANDFVGLLENVQAIVSEFLAQQNPAQANGWLYLAIMAMFAFVPYLLASYFLKPFREEERAIFKLSAQTKLIPFWMDCSVLPRCLVVSCLLDIQLIDSADFKTDITTFWKKIAVSLVLQWFWVICILTPIGFAFKMTVCF